MNFCGKANVERALDWIRAQIGNGALPAAFDMVAVGGQSAGSSALSLGWMERTVNAFEAAKYVVLSDSLATLLKPADPADPDAPFDSSASGVELPRRAS